MPEIQEENRQDSPDAGADEHLPEQDFVITEDGEIIRRRTSPYDHRQVIFEEPSVG
jgi:hypothetical protein